MAGVVTADGVERPADAIVWGTGFRVTDMPYVEWLRGRDGRVLGDVWREQGMQALRGTTVAGFPNAALQAAIDRLAAADAIIAATPVYKAGISGLFKSFVDVLDDDLIVAKPVLLAATGGTPRHALVIDDQMRPLFAYLRGLTLPTSVYAAPEDWGTTGLGTRIERAASAR